jgi:hypothetical protein
VGNVGKRACLQEVPYASGDTPPLSTYSIDDTEAWSIFCELEESGDPRFNMRGVLRNGAIVTLSASLLERGGLNVDLGDVGEGAMFYSIGQHRLKLSLSMYKWPVSTKKRAICDCDVLLISGRPI